MFSIPYKCMTVLLIILGIYLIGWIFCTSYIVSLEFKDLKGDDINYWVSLVLLIVIWSICMIPWPITFPLLFKQ